MIPKYLKIKGLYSYQTEQEIHFDALTDASLFGIFGSVGSGKSSVLEAITFALYGDTERLNKAGDDRTYNMMNLRSDELLIDFECIAGKNAELYRFTVKGKRNSKNFKEVKTFERKAYIWKENNWIPLSENETTESIIGLSYDNFRRTIIIPQGRFQEFIELKDAERTRMMKELFQLEKYDLSRNVGTLSKRNDLELSNLDGQLQGIGDVTQEMIAEQDSLKTEVISKITAVNNQLISQTSQLEQLQQVKAAFEKMQLLKNQLLGFESQQAGILEREENLRIFEICSLHLKTFLDQQKRLKTDIIRDQSSHEKNTIRETELANLLNQKKEILTSLHDRYEKRQELLDLAEELEKVIQIKDLASRIKNHYIALTQTEEKLKNQEELIALYKKEKLTIEDENELKKGQLIDVNILSQIKAWFALSDELEQNRKAVYKEAIDLDAEIKNATTAREEKISKASSFFGLNLEVGSSKETIAASVENYLRTSETEKEGLTKQTLLIQTQMALNQYATNLADGEPCPLCGAEHHPSVLHVEENLAEQITVKDSRRNQIQKLEDSIRRFHADIEKDSAAIDHLGKQTTAIKARYTDLKDRIKAHDLLFVWEKFSKDNREAFESKLALMEQLQKQIKDNEIKLKAKNADIEKASLDKTEQIEKPLQELKNEILRIENTTSTLSGQLVQVSLTEFSHTEKQEIIEKVLSLKKSFEEVKQIYEQTETQIDVLDKEKNTISGSQATLLETLTINQNELKRIQVSIHEQLLKHEFESEKQVESILEKHISIDVERKEIDAFKTALGTVKRDLEILQKENQDKIYSTELHEQLIKEKDELTVNLNALRKEEGRLDGLLKKLTDDFLKKGLLLKEKGRLQVRKSHLDDLAKLFRSSGFVDYASSIYLQNLIQAANHRFHQMTHQQLHLELGEGNSFWVRDLLNGGHMRLLKTLSGGQKFQAALSLALALADHIHIRNESRHNFFFLDEGFGSLDKNALQTVFETLKSLRKENRIVGIISHVEELQQEIQTYLKIEQTEEGSRIVSSWK
ncbi:SMC family ATPase [Dyadobacter sp. CY312]|uniref:AAA family ATPase n=1 Tax=Dyadobacter sp. CY312 TaxID=2907303 RepID=UPI001F15DC89|nr:SMC family ATPase [Dyadobacter sp. CY312]MCE7043574.1 SMC family ATPase [Dyadobacter sp. CY312]